MINTTEDLLPKFGTNFLTSPIFISNLSAIFYNNLTEYHKKLQVFLGLMDNHCVNNVMQEDIQDQLQEYSILNYFILIKFTSSLSIFLNHLNSQ